MQETITIRPTIPKSELIKRSGGNLNKWINGLIEQALGERALDWERIFVDRVAKSGFMPTASGEPGGELCGQ